MSARLHREESGFTLIELLVVMVIAAVVLGITGSGIVTAFRFEREQSAHVNAMNQTKVAFERIGRDIRGAAPLYAAEPNSIRTQIRHPGGDFDVVEWRLEGTQLVRNGGEFVIPGVELPPGASLFTYFDLEDRELPLPDEGPDIPNVDVRRVEIHLRIPYGYLGRAVELTEDIMLRNSEA